MRITIDIQDNEAPFLLELLKKLNGVSIVPDENFDVPEWHKTIVMERVNDPNATYTEADEFFKKLDKEIL